MTHQHLGSVRRRLGDFAGARAEFETAESIWLQLHGDRSEQLAGLINNRAWIMIDLAASAGGRPLREAYLEEALAHLLDSSNLIRSLVSPNDYRVGLSERSIGKVLAGLGKNRQAVERFDESIRILSSRMGDEFDSVQEAKLLRARCRMDLGFEIPTSTRPPARKWNRSLGSGNDADDGTAPPHRGSPPPGRGGSSRS